MTDRETAATEFAALTRRWFDSANRERYSYQFSWLGRPIIQYPQDIVAVEQLIWAVKPDLIIETGVAHGGSIVFSASMLALLDYADAIAAGTSLDPLKTSRRVIGIDIEIRPANRAAIAEHPMAHRIDLIEGSSIDPAVVGRVREMAARHRRIMVLLDSNHTHDHVLAELRAYAPLTSRDSYCVVFDTVIADLPPDAFPDRPWGPGNNPRTAVAEYLAEIGRAAVPAADGKRLAFSVDSELDRKLAITVAPGGYLKRVDW